MREEEGEAVAKEPFTCFSFCLKHPLPLLLLNLLLPQTRGASPPPCDWIRSFCWSHPRDLGFWGLFHFHTFVSRWTLGFTGPGHVGHCCISGIFGVLYVPLSKLHHLVYYYIAGERVGQKIDCKTRGSGQRLESFG